MGRRNVPAKVRRKNGLYETARFQKVQANRFLKYARLTTKEKLRTPKPETFT